MTTNRAVLPKPLHTDVLREDDNMDEQQEKYDATYTFGNTKVHVVSPKDVTPEKFEQVMKDFHNAGWSIINELVQKGEDI